MGPRGKLPTELRLIVSGKTSDAGLRLQHILEEELMARERTVNPREKTAAPSQRQHVAEGPHVQRSQPCFPVFRQVLPAVTVNNCTHCLNVLMSMKCRLEDRFLSLVDAALTAYAVVTLWESAGHRVFACSTAIRNIIPAPAKEGRQRTPSPRHRRLLQHLC